MRLRQQVTIYLKPCGNFVWKCKEEAMPPYIVFSDKTLIDMCIKCPSNEEEMLEVSGVGENKLKKYGQRFLEEIQKFCLERPNADFEYVGR